MINMDVKATSFHIISNINNKYQVHEYGKHPNLIFN